jgi:hypothetical protein
MRNWRSGTIERVVGVAAQMHEARGRLRHWRALAGRLWLAGSLAALIDIGSPVAAPVTIRPATPKTTTQPAKKVTTPAQRCKDLEEQFDTALPKHVDAKNLSTAQRLRAEGQHLCEEGQHAAGALRLAKALVDLGVKPDVN